MTDHPIVRETLEDVASNLASLSQWIDDMQGDRDPEAIAWGRISKIAEECGEAIAAFIGATGQNPRKGITHDLDDVMKELLDVAVTALGAYEHLDGNAGRSVNALIEHIDGLLRRVHLK